MVIIDLRSDTVTLPTLEMHEAMFYAELGDDVFGDDPATIKLEEYSANMVEKEAAVFVPSGTMGNLISMLSHCQRGDEVILGDKSHMFLYEAGGVAVLGGIQPHILKNNRDGTIDISLIKDAIRPDDIHYPRTRVVCIENTHNYYYGSPIPADYIAKVAEVVKENNLFFHLDGARIFNACVALEVDIKEFSKHVDSLMFCLSKGLSAPVGSVLCGSSEFIKKARKNRKMLGGGMRQTGILAAAGIVALEDMTERLIEDHINAQKLADELEKFDVIDIDPSLVKTNIIYFTLDNSKISDNDFLSSLEERGVKILNLGQSRFRLITHHGITADEIEKVIYAIGMVVDNL